MVAGAKRALQPTIQYEYSQLNSENDFLFYVFFVSSGNPRI